jgi:endonuclease/exonuclease/phosphatase family metal-dependent hydrolase
MNLIPPTRPPRAGELHPSRTPVLRHFVALARWLRRWLNRPEWGVRLLRLPRSHGTAHEPGLVLIQLDGLARPQVERALRAGRLPFLRHLLRREGYRVHTHYSGLPATTPAVQGELFFGVRRAVPAFAFFDRRVGRPVEMHEPAVAARVQKELAGHGPALLEGGSAYSNIYSGGARECHFCAVCLGWEELFEVPLLRVFLLAVLNWLSVVRAALLLGLEFVVAFVDFLRGLIAGRELWHELKFVPRRAAVSVFLRELITLGAEIDVTRGLPVVQVNFLGYDEQAHHRGPDSAFAHWSLEGIDDAVRRIWRAAHASPRRDYQVWIYSDHGQERTVPYSRAFGRTVWDAVEQVFAVPPALDVPHRPKSGTQAQRAQWLGKSWQKRPAPPETTPGTPTTVAVGPLGYIYPAAPLTPAEREALAPRLVHEAQIPLVLTVGTDDAVWAWNAAGRFRLPEQAGPVVGEDHPFLADVAQDLPALCRHPDAGEFLISGWRPRGRPISFVTENGAHGGPGRDETRGFLLLPGDAPLPDPGRPYFRSTHLREAALAVLGRGPVPERAPAVRTGRRARTLRVMTYNVHGCVGLDGRLSPARIARVIAQADADVVALQELDVGRVRSDGVDQAGAIAERLEMGFHFHPAWQLEEERYGDAVLSRLPLRLVHAGRLPGKPSRFCPEPRGALWVAVTLDGHELQLLNTHLGLNPQERLAQAEALLGPDWLSHPACREPVVLCGDLNARPQSAPCRLLLGRLRDAQPDRKGRRPVNTWPTRYPVARIDHVFVSRGVRVLKVGVLRTQLARVASDHLPLVVDVELP